MFNTLGEAVVAPTFKKGNGREFKRMRQYENYQLNQQQNKMQEKIMFIRQCADAGEDRS